MEGDDAERRASQAGLISVRYQMLLGPPRGERLFDWETLEELVEAAVEEPSVLSFHPQPGRPYTVPEAFSAVVQALESREVPDAQIECIFASERAISHAARHLPLSQRAPQRFAMQGREVHLALMDLLEVHADAIVNASSTSLRLGGGVSGAIRAAVQEPDALQAAMYAQAPIAEGALVSTPGFGLAGVSTILHVATAQGDAKVVLTALGNALDACEALKLSSVAIPALGCGTGGLPVSRFAELAKEALSAHRATLPKRVILVCFELDDQRQMSEVFEGESR